jgi:hypothetical protein
MIKMSYTLNNNCYACSEAINCTDYKIIQEAINKIHEKNHIGYGQVNLICGKTHQNLSFGEAINAMKSGYKVKLPHWKDDVFISIQFRDDHSKMTHNYIYVTSRLGLVPWVATQVEMLSNDWVYDGCQNELDILKIKIGNGESL